MATPCAANENGSKPAEIFRKDLISAMKLPDGHNLQPDEYHVITDPWKPEWERGVQVCVNDELSLKPQFKRINSGQRKKDRKADFKLPKQRIRATPALESEPMYDLDQMDLCWLKDMKRRHRGTDHGAIELDCFEKAITKLELESHRKFVNAIATEEGLGIEYDATIPCDVCGETDAEEGNEMIFCDLCNVCVHQACYGIRFIPDGNWLCRPCMQGVHNPECVLCPKTGGAMKPIRFRRQWCHVRCALWIPEVGFGNVERMEPITKCELIPQSRWNLLCVICKEKQGACIQCSIKSCTVAYHVTCAVKAGLYLKTTLDTSHNELGHVTHVSHCPKHTKELSPNLPSLCPRSEIDIGNIRESRLKHLEENVHALVSPKDVIDVVQVSQRVASLVYNYWKMKRKANGNRSLLDLPDPKKEAEDLKRRNQATIQTGDPNWEAYTQQKIDLEKLLTLRTDMEKARNLSYMLIRREKQKREHLLTHQAVTEKRCKLVLEEALEVAKQEQEKSKQREKAEMARGRRCCVKEWANHRRRPGGDGGTNGGRSGGLGWNGVRLRPRTLAQQSRDRKKSQKRDSGGSENEVRCERNVKTELLLTSRLRSGRKMRSTVVDDVDLPGNMPLLISSKDVPSERNQTQLTPLNKTIVSDESLSVSNPGDSSCDRVKRKRKSDVSCDGLLVDNLWDRASLEAIVGCLRLKHSNLIEETLEKDEGYVAFDVHHLQEAIQSEKSIRSWVSHASQALDDYEAQQYKSPALKMACSLQVEFERLLQCAFPRRSAQLLRDVRKRHQHGSKRRCLKSPDHGRDGMAEKPTDDRLSSVLMTPKGTPVDSQFRKALSSAVSDISITLAQMPSPASSDELIVVV